MLGNAGWGIGGVLDKWVVGGGSSAEDDDVAADTGTAEARVFNVFEVFGLDFVGLCLFGGGKEGVC